jgi:hypothetical protein
MVKRETRVYFHEEHGKNLITKVNYRLVFIDRKLVRIFNDYGFSVESNSECWDYFNQKYN